MARQSTTAASTPKLWEKIVGYGVALWIIGLVSYLLIRNAPFNDPNLVVAMRILLSLSVAIVGAVIPGFLSVDLRYKGASIRAGAALALFVFTYWFSPKVINSLRLPPVLDAFDYPSDLIINERPTSAQLDVAPTFDPKSVTFNYKNEGNTDLYLFVYDFGKKHRKQPAAFAPATFWTAWPFPADDQWHQYDDFKRSNGWFGFAVGWAADSGSAMKHQYLASKNIFASKSPSLVVFENNVAQLRFNATFSDAENPIDD
jgi:hypothetical protein